MSGGAVRVASCRSWSRLLSSTDTSGQARELYRTMRMILLAISWAGPPGDYSISPLSYAVTRAND
eukprot:scaffold4271_cov57-Phaeocystis_antarctica.AAC.2